MKSGNSFTMKFDRFSIDKLSSNKDNREMNYKNAESNFTVDISEIECVITKKVWF